MIKAIIFDWGGVLAKLPTNEIIGYCAKHFGFSRALMQRAFAGHLHQFQTGEITENEFWRQIHAKYRRPVPNIHSLWYNAFRFAYSPRKKIFSLAAELKRRGYKIGLLSNTEKPAMDFFYNQHYPMFNAAVFSCAEGVAKPVPRIYKTILNKLKVKPEEAIFIDDTRDFVKAAQKIGLKTILFKNSEQTKKELLNLLK